MGQVFAGRAPASMAAKFAISDFWAEAPIEWTVLAWAAFAGGTTNDFVDQRFRAEVGSITAEERAYMLGWRLAAAHGHDEASRTPGPWSAVWALRGGFPVEWHDDGLPGIAISSIRKHVTGTGRLCWEARGDGSLLIEVWRGPSGGAEPHRVISAVIPTATPAYSASPVWEDGIDPSFISIKAYAPYGRRHLDVLISAISTAVWRGEDDVRDLKVLDMTAPDLACVRIADANPEPDPWDPALSPEPLPAGARVRFDLGDYGVATGEATGETPEWGQYERSWGQWVKADHDGNRWFVPVGDVISVEEDE